MYWRKTLRIREGDPLEIFTAKDGEVILKKYSPIGELNEFSQEYAETLGETLGYGVIITDLDSIISVSKLPKKDYKEKSISKELEQLIENRETKEIKIAAPEFRVWSPTTLLGQALTSLTTVDRTGNGAFW